VGLEDFSEEFLTPAVGVVAAATAVLFSPPVRALARKAAVSGLAGLLTAGDGIAKLVPGRDGQHARRDGAPPDFVRRLALEARAERARNGEAGREAVEADGENAGAAHAQP
jgi:hypothetical protein